MATSNITVPALLWWPDWKQVCWQNWAWCMPCRRSEAGRGTCELVHFWVSQKRCNLHFFWLFKGFLLPNLIVGGCSGWWLWTPKWLQTLCLKNVHLRNVSKLSTGPEEIVKWSWQPGNMVVDSSLRHGSWYSRVLQKIRPGASSWGQIHCQCCCPEEVFKWFPDVYMTLKVDWGVVFQRVSWTSLVGVHVTPSNADVPPRKSLRLQVLVLGMDRQWILNAQWSTQRKAEVAGSPGGADVRARTGRDGLPPSNRAWRPGSRREQGRGASG